MPGRSTAPRAGDALRDHVAGLGRDLGLDARIEVRVGRRVWGAERFIDVVLTQRATHPSLEIECKVQNTAGSAEEKIPTTIQDIRAWPIRGIVCFAGEGLSTNMRAFLVSTGLAVEFENLGQWLRLYFGLLEDEGGRG